jgi:hypothetical protein
MADLAPAVAKIDKFHLGPGVVTAHVVHIANGQIIQSYDQISFL